jgi:hypothetical protein
LEFKRFVVDCPKQSVFGVMERVSVVNEISGLQAFELILHFFTMPNVGCNASSWARGITLGQEGLLF